MFDTFEKIADPLKFKTWRRSCVCPFFCLLIIRQYYIETAETIDKQSVMLDGSLLNLVFHTKQLDEISVETPSTGTDKYMLDIRRFAIFHQYLVISYKRYKITT